MDPIALVRSLALIVAAASSAVAQVAGAAAAPRPGPLPGAWLTWHNDALGGEVGENPDDFRTTALVIDAAVKAIKGKIEGIECTPRRQQAGGEPLLQR